MQASVQLTPAVLAPCRDGEGLEAAPCGGCCPSRLSSAPQLSHLGGAHTASFGLEWLGPEFSVSTEESAECLRNSLSFSF